MRWRLLAFAIATGAAVAGPLGAGAVACGDPLTFEGGDAGADDGTAEAGSTPAPTPDGSSAPASFCLTSPEAKGSAFCADFDEGALRTAYGPDGARDEWVLVRTGPGELALEGDGGHSAPGSLRAHVPMNEGGLFEESIQFTGKLFRAMPRSVRIAFWVRIDAMQAFATDAGAPVVALGGLEMGTGATPYKIHLALKPPDPLNGATLVVTEVNHPNGAGAAFKFVAETPARVKPGVWTRLELVVRLAESMVDVGWSTDTQPPGDAGSYALELDPPSEPTVTVGLLGTGSAAWTAHFDDYHVEIVP